MPTEAPIVNACFADVSNKAVVGAFIPWSYNHPEITKQHLESRQIYSPSDDQLERACPPKNHNVETLPNKYSRYISSSSWKNLSRPWILPAVDTTWRPLEDLCTRDKHFNFSRASSNYVTLEQPKPQQCCSLASALSESQVTTRKHQHSQYLPATRVNHNRQFDARPRGLVVIHGG